MLKIGIISCLDYIISVALMTCKISFNVSAVFQTKARDKVKSVESNHALFFLNIDITSNLRLFAVAHNNNEYLVRN